MNEYKAYKNLVKHKKRINRVFSEVCGDKSFCSRRPGRKLKISVVDVATCSAGSPKAPRRRSSKSGVSIVDETTSSGVQPSKTRSLESSKRKRKTSEQVSDAELQAASSLAQMSRKKAKKAVKKVVSSEVRRFPSAFNGDLFVESSQKGFSFGLCYDSIFMNTAHRVLKMSSWTLILFQMLLPKFRRKSFPLLLLRVQLLLWILLFLSLLILKRRHLPNSREILI
jgi:hypothetical protein